MKKEYMICPGWVVSKRDSDLHWISAPQLIKLYQVNPQECIINVDKRSREAIDVMKLIECEEV